MKKIRQGVFETNSSAVHTITIRNLKLSKSRFRLKDGVLTTEFGEFDSKYGILNTPAEKLSYLVTLCTHSCIIDKSDWKWFKEQLENSGDFQYIEEDLKEYIPGMTKLEVKPSKGSNNHQTRIDDVRDFLGTWGGGLALKPHEFIFCDDIVVEMGND